MSNHELEAPKAILIDLDGTVQGPAHDALPSPETVYWIRRAIHEREIGVGVVTGRPYRLARESINMMGVDLLSAFDGGGIFQNPRRGNVWKRYPMSRNAQLGTLSTARAMNIPLYDSEQQFNGSPITSRREVTKKNTKLHAGPLNHELAEDFATELAKEVEGVAAYVSTSWTPGNYADVHITDHRATKGQAAEYIICNYTQIEPKDVWVFGDGPLDIPMFQNGVVSFAMSNAPDEVKAAATYVAGSWAENGVAEIIRTKIFGENRPPALANLSPNQSAVSS